jgi:hypothetical protein
VASTRYIVEQGIEEAKGATGFDRYEVRTWPSWYRHLTLTMLAHAWLAERRPPAMGGGSGGTSSAGTSGSPDSAGGAPPARNRFALARPLES